MKDVTSLEKSKALKAAGVQPKTVEDGQVWYARYDDPFLVTKNNKDGIIDGFFLSTGVADWFINMGGYFYAFTSSDLLPMLPIGTRVEMWDGKFSVKLEGENPKRFTGDNMAEVMAEAVLSIKNEQNG